MLGEAHFVESEKWAMAPRLRIQKGFPVLGGIQDISRREVSQAVKWDSWKENVLGQFPEGTIVVGICFMRGDELSFPEGEQNISER
ncbi:hypothetical protein CEXT_70241, partial [Caerostris extrusa]